MLLTTAAARRSIAAGLWNSDVSYGFLSLLPSLLAIGLALLTRQVYGALLLGVAAGHVIMAGHLGSGAAATVEGIVGVLGSQSSANVIVFTLVMGSLIAVMRDAGGLAGFVTWLRGRGWVDSGVRSQWLAYVLGIIIFIESNITVLVAGSVARPLFDRFGQAREKLAYIIDSTSAPICMLIPLNAWGAYNMGLLSGAGVEDALGVLVAAVPLNLYAVFAVLLTGIVVATGWNIGPMRGAEDAARQSAAPASEKNAETAGETGAVNMLLPILTLIAVMPVGLWITGQGDLRQGSGSTSVLWAALAALFVACVTAALRGRWGAIAENHSILGGARELLPMALVMLLAFALGDVARALGAGQYVAQLVPQGAQAQWLLPAVFVISGVVAFSIGSSWSTFAILIPIVVPLADALGQPLAPFVAAALSGGIFGDHSSPISDTTIVSSLASGSDHIAHVRTQLPYALLAAAPATVGFFVMGLVLPGS